MDVTSLVEAENNRLRKELAEVRDKTRAELVAELVEFINEWDVDSTPEQLRQALGFNLINVSESTCKDFDQLFALLYNSEKQHKTKEGE